jgi:hypothetical protein
MSGTIHYYRPALVGKGGEEGDEKELKTDFFSQSLPSNAYFSVIRSSYLAICTEDLWRSGRH